jgi:hypothetical protein
MAAGRRTPTDTRNRSSARVKEKGRRRPWWRRRSIRLSLALLGTLIFVAFLDAAWVATTATRELRSARDSLQRGASSLVEGRIDDARAAFVLAKASADRAVSAMGHPTGRIGSELPVIGDDIRAVKAMGTASELAATAGSSLVRAAQEAGWHGSTTVSLGKGGPFPLTALEVAAPDLDAAASLLAQAEATLTPIELKGLTTPVRDAFASARETLGRNERVVRSAATLGHLLPTFLGGEGPRRYLLVSLNLSDPRGSGGYPGTYGVLRADDGRLSLEAFGPTSDLGVVPAVSAPPDVVKRYKRFGALTHFIASTYSPDFPTSARLLLEMWDASGREPLDGVIAVDSVWSSYLLAEIGPVETPAWPEPINAENASTVINHDTFLTTSQARSNHLQDAIGEALLRATLERPVAPTAMASALARATSERHLQIYSTDPTEEELLRQLGASGELELGPDPLLVAWDGATGSRAGYFAEKSIAYRAELQPDGSTNVTIRLTLRNRAPSGPPSILLGVRGAGVPIGTYWAYANVYLPAGAEDIRGRVLGQPSVNLIEQEFGHPVVLQLLRVTPRGSVTGTISYRLPGALTGVGDREGFRVDILPEPALRPDEYSVDIVPPSGSAIEATDPPMAIQGGDAHYQGATVVPTTLQVWIQPQR